MKHLLLFIFIIFHSIGFSQTEKYRVLRIKDGAIVVKTGNKPLRKGDQITSSDRLAFSSTKTMGIVATKKREIYLLKNTTGKAIKAVEAIVKYDKNKLSKGVADSIVSAPILKHFFNEKPFIIEGEELRVPISPQVEKLDDSTFFYVQYKHKGKTYPVKLKQKGQTVIFSKKIMYHLSSVTVDQEDVNHFQLYIRYDKEGKSLLIADMDAPLFIDEQ